VSKKDILSRVCFILLIPLYAVFHFFVSIQVIMQYIFRFTLLIAASLSALFSARAQCPNPTVANAGPDMVLTCRITAVNLNGSSNVPFGNYSWSGPGILFGPNTINPLVSEPGVYTLTVIDPVNGCTDTDEVVVTMDMALPVVTAVSAGVLNCFTPTVNLQAVATPAQTTYRWTGPNGFISTLQNPSVTVAGNYTVQATSAQNGCTATATIAVLSDPIPPQIFISRLAGNGCLNTLVANSPTPGVTYSWTGPSGFSTTTATIQPPVAGTYTVQATGPNGCTATAAAVVTDTPPNMQAPANVTLCSGSSLVTNFQGIPGTTYNWTCSNPNINLPASGTGNIQRLVLSNIEQTAIIIVTPSVPGCEGIPRTFTVTVRPQPQATITGATHACPGESVVLTASGGDTYRWNNGNTNPVNTVTPTPNQNIYAVTVTGANGCSVVRIHTIRRGLSLQTTGGVLVCNSQSTGSIDLNVVNGTAPFTFLWSNGITSETLNNVPPGRYFVTATDAAGCSGTSQAQIDTIPGLTKTTIASCALSDTDTLFVSNGNYAYQLDWTHIPGVNDPPYLSQVPPGVYTLTIFTQIGCSATRTVTVTPGTAPTLTTTVTNVSCFLGTDGNIALNVAGGTPPFTYRWSNGTTSSNATNLRSGDYFVTVRDNNGCTATVQASVNQPTQLMLTVQNSPIVTCNGLNATVTGGVAPYQLMWSNGGSLPAVCGLVVGTYTVTATDANGCTATASRTFPNQSNLVINFTTNNVSCFGGSNGAVLANVTGGSGSYILNWSNGVNASSISNLTAGNYTVTVQDIAGGTAVATATVTQPPQLLITAVQTTPAGCNNATGSASATVVGGIPGSYRWFNSSNATQTISVLPTVNNLSAGIYIVQVTDFNGCTATATVTIVSVNTQIVVTTTTTPAFCNGANDGSITVIVTGGTGGTTGYTYNWSNGVSTWSSNGGAIQNLSNVTAGIYNVTVTDANGCTATATATVTQPPPFSVNLTVTQTTCTGGGQIAVNVTGGQVPFLYSWTGGLSGTNPVNIPAGTYTITVRDANDCSSTATARIGNIPGLQIQAAELCLPSAELEAVVNPNGAPYTFNWAHLPGNNDPANIFNLSPGTYTVTATAANGCSQEQSFVVPAGTAPNVSLSATSVSCNGGNNGSITSVVTGGSGTFTYLWSNGATTSNLNNLQAGTYTVTVTGSNGCTRFASATVTQPLQLRVSTGVSNVSCNGSNNGSIDINPSGGTPFYSHIWSNGASTARITNLTAGIYTVTVRDANGCTVMAMATVTQPTQLVVTTTAIPVSCFGANNGVINVTVPGGGTPGYTYIWSNGATTPTANNLTAGTYTVTVRDANNCSATATATVTQPTQLVATTTAIPASCFGANNGVVTAMVTGGNPGYLYTWSGNLIGANPTNVSAGTYTVTVIDTRGCSATATATVTQPTPFNINLTVTQTTCTGGGQIAVNVTGGQVPFLYSWTGGLSGTNPGNIPAGTYTITVRDANDCSSTATARIGNIPDLQIQAAELCLPSAELEAVVNPNGAPYTFNWAHLPGNNDPANIFNLPPGTYTVTATAANGCSQEQSFVVPAGTAPNVSLSATSVSCNGGNNGSITSVVTGGSGTFTYLWSNGATTSNLNNLQAGTYTVTVTDSNGCTRFASATVTQPIQLRVSTGVSNVSCNGSSNGSIDINPSGGTPSYSYQWSNGATTPRITNLAAGTYTVTVRDANNCTVTATATVTQQLPVVVNLNIIPLSCTGTGTGMITAFISPGTPPFSFLWSNGATTAAISNLAAGTYTVTATNSQGCTGTATGIIAPQSLTVTVASIIPPECYGATGTVSWRITNGQAPYTYSVSGGQTVVTSTNQFSTTTGAGVITITVTDSRGCTGTQTVTMNQPVELQFIPVFCDTLTTVSITGGTAPYLIQWPGGATGATQSLPPGNYTVTVTDSKGCTISKNIWVSPDPTPCTLIQGSVRFDVNNNCVPEATEPGLGGRVIQARNTATNQVFLAQTQPNGTYILRVVPGNYVVILLNPPSQNQLVCNNGINVTLPQQGASAIVNFAVQRIPVCPKMTVDVSTNWLRRCFGGNYYNVRCCNTGPVPATNAYVDVTLDPFLVYENSTRPAAALGNNVYRFQLGTVQANQCINFSIAVKVSCDAVLGQTHCTEAHVYPDSTCTAPNPQWRGGQVTVDARCSGDSLRFILKNIGKNPLTQNLEYIVIEDGIMARMGQGISLPGGDSMLVALPANGRTWRIEARQEPFAPGPLRPALSVEGCRLSGAFTTGFVTQFPVVSSGPWQDIDCSQNRGAFDPNDKAGTPVGYGNRRYIRPGTDIEYKIRFQNTGTDTAFNVVIRDTLSRWLDPLSIRPGVSSHPYEFELTGKGVLVFSFPNIMLPDSNINERLSNGFVTYNVAPLPTTPLETDIFNRAAIYFDFNDPIFTNTTVHRVGENFVTVRLWEPQRPEYTVRVMPQPMSESARIIVEKVPPVGDYTLQIFDLNGILVRSVVNSAPVFDLQRDNLPDGLYVFKVLLDGALTGNGKVLIMDN
jgi:uncharacterized repeat protein (TIGR01451 family)